MASAQTWMLGVIQRSLPKKTHKKRLPVPLFWSACVANTTPPAENPETTSDRSISVVGDEKSFDVSFHSPSKSPMPQQL